MTTNPFRWSFRAQYLSGFLACCALLGFAFYLQFHDGLLPCPLCIFQRVAFAALGLVFLIGGLHAPARRGGRWTYGVLALIAAAIGAAIAGRHVWLQHLQPDQVPACGPGLSWMMETMPATGVIRQVLTGSGECASVDWSLLGVSMPGWSLLCFIVLGAWAILAACRHRS